MTKNLYLSLPSLHYKAEFVNHNLHAIAIFILIARQAVIHQSYPAWSARAVQAAPASFR